MRRGRREESGSFADTDQYFSDSRFELLPDVAHPGSNIGLMGPHNHARNAVN